MPPRMYARSAAATVGPVAAGTSTRGPNDTAARNGRAPDGDGPALATRRSIVGRLPRFSRSAFRIALLVAALLHLPFVPSNLGEWLRLALVGEGSDYDDPDAQAIIPIDLDLTEAPNDKTTTAEVRAPSSTPPDSAIKPGEGAATDAGVPPDAGIADAGTGGDAGAPRRKAPPSDGGDDAGTDAGPPPLRDPIASVGGAGKIAAKDPNVQIYIGSKVLRKHELGAWFGKILVLIPEWHAFFADSPLDPIRDVDHLLLTSPRIKGDTSKMVVVMALNAPQPKVREAVDQLVTSVKGTWIEDAPLPAARARVGGAERIFAMVPGRGLVIVVPDDAKDQLSKLKSANGFKTSTVGIRLSMITPARPLRTVFPLPESLKWLRLALTPTAAGADVTIELGDASPEDAAAHAAEITKTWEQKRKLDLGFTSMEVLEPTTFSAEGTTIRATVSVPANKLRMILSFVEKKVVERYDGRAPG